MIANELIFIIHTCIITISVTVAAYLGKEALVSLIMLFVFMANLFVTQAITLFGFTATSSEAFIVGCSLSLILLQEHYGSTTARRAIIISFFGLITALIMTRVQLWYLPIPSDIMQPAFRTILQYTPRIVLASIIAYLLSQYSNSIIYAFLQKKLPHSWFTIKAYCALACAHLIDTLAFAFIGLYGIIHPITSVILVSYLIKIVTIVIASPLVSLGNRLTH